MFIWTDKFQKNTFFYNIVDYFVYCCSKKVALWLQYQCTWCDRLDSKSKTAVDSLHQPHCRLMTGVYPQEGAVSAWSKTWEQVYGRDRSPSTNKMSAISFLTLRSILLLTLKFTRSACWFNYHCLFIRFIINFKRKKGEK